MGAAGGNGLAYVYKDKRDQYRFRVKGDLWRAMSSESYENRSDCCRAMALLVTAVVAE
ncbi:MAG: hypothetical protein WCK89_25615 [bacterium]